MDTLKEEENHFKNFDSPCNINNNHEQQQQQQHEEDEELKPIADTDTPIQPPTPQHPQTQQPQPIHQHKEELNKVTNSPNPLSISVSSSLGSPSSIQLAPQGTIGNYLVIKTIGRGQFGKVKLGYHKKIPNEKVAIKIINKGKLDPETLKMVQREVRIMKLLHHPNIIRLYEVIETNRALYLIMEYAGEGEVMDFMIAHGVLTELQARTFFTQIVSAINYCHSKKAVHRDLKPENLLLDLNRQIKIIDFGLSNVFTPGSYLKTFCGSPTYASPELILRKEYNGPSVDVWSMGVVLFVLVTGYLPFDGDNYVELFQKILAGDYQIPSYLTNDCKSLISRMLVVDPEKRATMDEIINHPWLSSTKQIILSTTMSNSLNNLNSCLENNSNNTTSDVQSMLSNSSNSNSSSSTTLPPQSPSQQPLPLRNEEPLDQEIIEELVGLGFEKEELCNSIRQNKYNDAASTYFLLQGKKQRESQQNQIEHAKKLEKFYAETLSIQPPVGENSPLIKYKRHHKRSNTVDSPKSSTSTTAHRNNHNRHSQHQQTSTTQSSTHQQQQPQGQVVNNTTTTTTTTTNTTSNTTNTSSTPNSVQSSSINSNNSSVNPSPLCLSNAIPVSLRDKLKEKETFSTSSNNSSNQSINSGSSSPPSTSPAIQPFSLASNHIQRRATASSLQHQSSSNNNSKDGNNSNNNNNGNIITRRLRSNSSSVADQSQRQESRKLEDDWVIFEDYSNERQESKNNHLGVNGNASHYGNAHNKKQKSPMHSFLSSFKNILKRSDDKSFTNPHSNNGGSISTSNTPRSHNNHSNLIGNGGNEDNSSNTASPNVISASTTTATTTPNTVSQGEPRIVRFVFGVNTTTMKDAPELMQQVLKVVDTFCIPHTKKAPYLIECETEGVRFSIEICRLPRLSVNGLKFKRVGGSSWRYKSICKDLLLQMKLNSQ